MNVTMSLTHLRALLVESAEAGAMKALTEVGLLKPYLSKQEAYKLYGRSDVDRWIKEGLIKPERDSFTSKWRLDRVVLKSISSASNRHTFLNTDQR